MQGTGGGGGWRNATSRRTHGSGTRGHLPYGTLGLGVAVLCFMSCALTARPAVAARGHVFSTTFGTEGPGPSSGAVYVNSAGRAEHYE